MNPQTLSIASSILAADVSTLGAELQNLRLTTGPVLQWDGDPAVWAGRAPILFPVIGVLRDDAYRLDGRTFAMPKHGFGRRSLFDVVSHDADRAVLRLVADDATRAAYPFEFALELAFTLVDARLDVVATLFNHGTKPMPASFGFHPAFRWPLPFDAARADHVVRFAHDEPDPIRGLDADGFLREAPLPTPVVGDVLALRDDLFTHDALIFDRLRSRRVSYGAAHGPRLDIGFDDFPTLGVWTKTGAGFVCIEPWQGFADPVAFDGDLRDKPGIVIVAPGASRRFAMRIAFVADPSH